MAEWSMAVVLRTTVFGSVASNVSPKEWPLFAVAQNEREARRAELSARAAMSTKGFVACEQRQHIQSVRFRFLPRVRD